MGSRSSTASNSYDESVTDESILDLANSTGSTAFDFSGNRVGNDLNLSYTQTDHGAVEAGLNTSLAALDFAAEAGGAAWASASHTVDNVLAQARSVAGPTGEQMNKNMLMIGGGLIALVVVIMVLKK